MKKTTVFLILLILFSGIIYSASITINTSTQRAIISPYIYGTNQQMEGDENLTIMRLGGNRMTGFNWENNASNAGTDWQNSSDDYMCGATGVSTYDCANTSGAVVDAFVDYNVAHGYKSIVTLPMAGYVAADKSGDVTTPAPSSRWDQVVYAKGSAFQYPPNLTDGLVYDDEEVAYLVQKYGNATGPNGVMIYQLDNEPALWPSTHPMIHPAATGAAELLTKGIALSTAIKNVDASAQVFGPVFYGVWSMNNLGNPPDWAGIQTAGNYDWYVDYYLDKMKQAETTAGKRLLDAIDIHFYSEAHEGLYPPFNYAANCRITDDACTSAAAQQARLQAPRTLWDPTYIENSSVGQWLQPILPLIPKVQASIDKYYPGTKIAFTEHGFGGGNDFSGGLCIADVLGIFGKYGVYVATMWKTGYGLFHSAAYKLYRNYNGADAVYGNTKIYCESSDVPNITSYASINGSDDTVVHIIVINKAATAQTANVNITSGTVYSTGEAWAFGGTDPSITQRAAPVISGNSFSYSVPAYSAFHFICRAGGTPTNTPVVTVTNTPTITVTQTASPVFSATPTSTPTSTVPVTILNTFDSETYNGVMAAGANSAISINTANAAAITEGSGSLKVDITNAAAGWNDGIGGDTGFVPSDWSSAASITMDVYVDPANIPWLTGSAWHELVFYVNTGDGKNYRPITLVQPLTSGMNHLTFPIDWTLDTAAHPADPNTAALAPADPISDYFFVINSDPANLKTGTMYFDDMVIHYKSATSTPTITATGTPSKTVTPTITCTNTSSVTGTATGTLTPTFTRTNSATITLSSTPSPVYTLTITGTLTPTFTRTNSATITLSPTSSPVYTLTITGTVTGTSTNTPTVTVTATPTVTGSVTRTLTATVTTTTTPTFTRTATPTNTKIPATNTATPTITQSLTISLTPTPGLSGTPTPAQTEKGQLKIVNAITAPNPYQGTGKLVLAFTLTRSINRFEFKLFTSSFRLVRDVRLNNTFASGYNVTEVNAGQVSGLANGTYYYVIKVSGAEGTSANSKLGVLVVIKK
jgi:hypothetical protein